MICCSTVSPFVSMAVAATGPVVAAVASARARVAVAVIGVARNVAVTIAYEEIADMNKTWFVPPIVIPIVLGLGLVVLMAVRTFS